MGTYPHSYGSVTITSPSIDVFKEILTTVDRFREIETKSGSISQNYLSIFDDSKNPEQISERADSVSVRCEFDRTGRRDFKETIKMLIDSLQEINPVLKEYSFSLSFDYFEDEWPYNEGYLEATIDTSYNVQSGKVIHHSIKEIYHEENAEWFHDFYGPIEAYSDDEEDGEWFHDFEDPMEYCSDDEEVIECSLDFEDQIEAYSDDKVFLEE
ncbi:TPA: hypothetical protein U2D09_000152 [Streptococcus suis]|nr:hypothetical protein [Streptococcus suis]